MGFWVRVLLAGVLLGGWAHALRVRVSEQQIVWLPKASIRTFFSALDYSAEEMHTTLPRLLASVEHKYRITKAYISQTLAEDRAQALLDAFLDRPALHPLVLPFELVVRSAQLMEAVFSRPADLPKYSPLLPLRESLVPEPWRETVLRMINNDPMLCADLRDINPGIARGIDCPWMAFYPGMPERPLQLRLPELVLLDMCLYKKIAMSKEEPTLQDGGAPLFRTDEPFDQALLQIMLAESFSAFPAALGTLTTLTAGMPLTLQALWHGKLLFIALESMQNFIHRHGEFKKELTAYCTEFIQAYEPTLVPPFLVKAIGMGMRLNAILLPAQLDHRLHQKLLLFDTFTARQTAFWGGLDRYLWAWRQKQKMAAPQNSHLAFPNNHSMLEWWAGTPGSIQNPAYPIGVKIDRGHADAVQFEDLLALLHEITHIIASTREAFEGGAAEGLYIKTRSTLPDYFWAATARTIAYNLFFFGDPRINLTSKTWKNVYSSTNAGLESSPCPRYPKDMISKGLYRWDVQNYIPLAMLVEKTPTVVLALRMDL